MAKVQSNKTHYAGALSDLACLRKSQMTELNAYYEGAALWDRDKYVSGYERERFLAGVDFIPPDAKSLLDVGCGNGAFLSFAEQARPDMEMAGVDPSGAAISQRWCKADVTQGSASALPFKSGAFDVVCSMAVLEHIPAAQIPAATAEIKRLASRYILLNLPYREQRTRIKCPECNCGFDPHLHLRSYDDAAISALWTTGFAERKRAVLSGYESIIPYTALRVLKFEPSAARFPNAICPQCGHASKKGSSAQQPAASSNPGILRRMWNAQPKIKVEREIYVLLERTYGV